MPGYTGHVPHKYDLFGVTAGDANKILITQGGKDAFFSGTINVKPSNSLYGSMTSRKNTTKYQSKTRPISSTRKDNWLDGV